jgi:hypothetical protein
MIEKFFFGLDGSGRDKEIDYPYVLISAATLWNGKRFKPAHFHENVKEIFLDSGGFSFFTKWSKYPFTTDEYLQFVRGFCDAHPQTKYVAIMDYPCEDYVNRADLWTNFQRIDETVKNAEALIHREILAEWVSVVQGYCFEEYSYCCEEMRKRGLWTPLTAVGSICTRKDLFHIKYILNMIRRKHRHVNLHAFGLEYRALADREVWDILYSVDSAAWKFTSNGNKLKPGAWRPGSTKEKMENFVRYKGMIDRLIADRTGNCELRQFVGCEG